MMNESWRLANATWPTIVLCVIVALIFLFIFFRQLKRYAGEPRAIALEVLRLFIVGLMLFTLLDPVKIMKSQRFQDPLIAVLTDESGSMDTRDVLLNKDDVITRSEWVNARKTEEFWKPLEEKYKVDLVGFDLPTEGSEDPGTDLNQALLNTAENYKNLRAVVLMSDGDWNKGKNPTTAASVLQSRDVPVYSMITGSDRYLPDIDLEDVKAPAYGLVEESLSIPFSVQSRMPNDVTATIKLLDQDNTIVSEKEVTIRSMSQVQDAIVLEPQDEGLYTYKLEVPNQRGEAFTDNNSKSFNIAMKKEVLRVMVIDSSPRWEYRYLRNALSRDPGVNVSCLLFHPGKGMSIGGGNDYISEFPKDLKELSEYDVIFLGDVGRDQLTDEQLDMIQGLVEKQGSGLVFLPGQNGNQATLKDHPIMDLNPVIMDDSVSEGFGSRSESKLVLTDRGRGHLLTMLAPEADINYRVWRNLPGFYWYAPVQKARPGSSVLGVHESARGDFGRVPLLVTRTCGSGKSLFMGTDAAWRWRRGVEDRFHYRFWGQVVRWMAHQRHLKGEEGIRFFYTPESPKRGEPVLLHATVFDRSGFPLDEGSVTVNLTSESGSSEIIDLQKEDGGYGVFTGTFTPERGGNFNLKVECDAAQRELETKLYVEAPIRERTGRPAKANVLRELSNVTKGKWYTMDQLDEMIQKVSVLKESSVLEERFSLRASLPWAGFIVLLFMIYWVCRKLLGLI